MFNSRQLRRSSLIVVSSLCSLMLATAAPAMTTMNRGWLVSLYGQMAVAQAWQPGMIAQVRIAKSPLQRGNQVLAVVPGGKVFRVTEVRGNWLGARFIDKGTELAGWIRTSDVILSNELVLKQQVAAAQLRQNKKMPSATVANNQATPRQPNESGAPGKSTLPATPNLPEMTKPEMTKPETLTTPEIPDLPGLDDPLPTTPEKAMPAPANTPVVPSLDSPFEAPEVGQPVTPETPTKPEMPAKPELPGLEGLEPETPAKPEMPAKPEKPAKTELPGLEGLEPEMPAKSEESDNPADLLAELLNPSKSADQPEEAMIDADGLKKVPGLNFKDDVQPNETTNPYELNLQFIDGNGNNYALANFNGKKNVVLVMMRGFSRWVCPGCSTQTARLIANYDEFKDRDAEVLIVYPGKQDTIPTFLDAVKKQVGTPAPFPILLDEELEAVKKLRIEADLAKPATYILDKSGKLRFAYVGTDETDRPSLKVMLRKLDEINGT